MNTRFEFTVSGYGDFPIDMLRYDSCWPKSGVDSAEVLKSFYPGQDRRGASRFVTLEGLNEPTGARWMSFRWTVHPDIQKRKAS